MIALIVGAVVTLTVFVLAMAALVFGDYFSERELLFYVSIALGPVAMISVMVGYAVWWLVVFLLTLFLPSRSPDDTL
jgi:NADH:ubiquinone oxidoreductase subunit 6 (subunit J)